MLAVGTVVGCSLIVQPPDVAQCSTNDDCARFPGSVCQEQFCVSAALAKDASTLDANLLDANADGDVPGDELSPRQGDVVLLLPGAFDYAADQSHVTAWRNAVPGDTQRRAVVTGEDKGGAFQPQPTVSTFSGQACLSFVEFQRMVLKDEGGLAPAGDFSVLAVVGTPKLENGEYTSGGRIPVARMRVNAVDSESFQATGWALKSAWESDEGHPSVDRFAASVVTIGGIIGPQNAKEVVDPGAHDTKLHVLGMTMRDAQLRLWVDGLDKGVLDVAVVQPPTADLTLGSIAPAPWQWAVFQGDLCAVIVHHGAESDAELAKRFGALKAQFQTP